MAVAILGKQGFAYLQARLFGLLRRIEPPDTVSRARYRIGVVMFVLPLLLAWLSVDIAHLIPGFAEHPVAFAVGGDVMFLASLFVLGGDFRDKIRALFAYGASARFPDSGA